jgi:hypothetical protein
MTDRFFEVSQIRRATSAGPVDLPILYRDVTNVVAIFEAPLAGVEAVLAGTGLEAAMVIGDRAMVGLSCYEYRDTSVGVYNEVGTAIFAVRLGERRPRLGWADMYVSPLRRTIAAYVVDLPVTTAAANAAGREIWGYPKFVTRIPFRAEGREIACSVEDPDPAGGRILSLSGRLGPGLPAPPFDLVTYSFLDGGLIRTPVEVRGLLTAHAPGTVRLEIGSSSHRMAANLRRLGLVSAKPRLVLRTDRFQSILHGGMRVAEIV